MKGWTAQSDKRRLWRSAVRLWCRDCRSYTLSCRPRCPLLAVRQLSVPRLSCHPHALVWLCLDPLIAGCEAGEAEGRSLRSWSISRGLH